MQQLRLVEFKNLLGYNLHPFILLGKAIVLKIKTILVMNSIHSTRLNERLRTHANFN